MKHALLIVCCTLAFSAFAQVQDPNSPGFDFGEETTEDTTVTDDETSEEAESDALVAKPYERITLNVDSVTNLITYTGVIEQEDSGSDSLYIRAKNWFTKYFNGKATFEADKKNQKIVVNASMEAYSYASKYSKRSIGKYNLKMTVWIKEGRYRYAISNLVHEGVKGNSGSAARNYFEYYYTTTRDIKGSDQKLRYADKDINLMIEDFVKAMKDPIEVDEEDW